MSVFLPCICVFICGSVSWKGNLLYNLQLRFVPLDRYRCWIRQTSWLSSHNSPPLSKTFFLTFVKDLKRIGLVIVEPRLGNYELSWPRSVLQLKMHTGCPKKKQLKETNPKQHCLIDVEPNFPLDMTWECLILLSLSRKRPKTISRHSRCQILCLCLCTVSLAAFC